MSFEKIRTLPSPSEIKKEQPLSKELQSMKKARDEEIKKVFTGESEKKILIIGPCSADQEEAVLDYIARLSEAQQ